ncbi:phosphatidylinositol N-acetylglucosaminyltransferase subunit C [Ischnura elegans]|uniref:phosphatidylinositol N-acetylglucosaminyltransferase subunit C n=1 Tax=Ischnura elegans TaxID=197161 RepID=UPI001ED89156|nr:phosphatidylinositol N-acetylglucosaminyltransferase subunit C [Ischnura elegans]
MESERVPLTAVRIKSKLKPWRKNVYDNKGYKDNYTDASFLEELKRNINFKEVPFSSAFIGAGLVTQQFCVVVLFSLVFTVMDYGWTDPNSVLYACGFATVVGYISRIYLLPRLQTFCTDSTRMKYSGELVLNDLVTMVKCLAFGHILSPVLKTLTETICTDTIQAASAIAFLVHIASYDYGIGSDPGVPYIGKTGHSPLKSRINAPSHWSSKSSPHVKRRLSKDVAAEVKNVDNTPDHCGVSGARNSGKETQAVTSHLYCSSRVSSALSLNAAIFGATCLASRLPSPSHAFALLSTAGLAFALAPPYLKLLHGWPPARVLTPTVFVTITAYSIFLCCEGMSTGNDILVDFFPLAIFTIVVLFINLLCPIMFVRWQAHKDNIYGPWDEAVPVIPRSGNEDALGNT